MTALVRLPIARSAQSRVSPTTPFSHTEWKADPLPVPLWLDDGALEQAIYLERWGLDMAHSYQRKHGFEFRAMAEAGIERHE